MFLGWLLEAGRLICNLHNLSDEDMLRAHRTGRRSTAFRCTIDALCEFVTLVGHLKVLL